MNVDSLKWIYFQGNETENCVIERIFSGNDQQKVYNPISVLRIQYLIKIVFSVFLN